MRHDKAMPELALPTDTMSTKECARAYGKSLNWWYRNWKRLRDECGMPDRLATVGHPRYPRVRFKAWLAGHKPTPAPANDAAAAAEPSIAEEQAALAKVYRTAS